MKLLTTAKNAFNALGALLKVVAANHEMKEAGSEVAKSVLTITKFLNVLLLPLAILNSIFQERIPLLRTSKSPADLGKSSRCKILSGGDLNETELRVVEAVVLLTILEAAPRPVTAVDLARLIRVPFRKLYLLLDTFEQRQWLTSEFGSASAPTGGPRRRYYQLTELGTCKARESCAYIASMSPAYNELRVRLGPLTSSDESTGG